MVGRRSGEPGGAVSYAEANRFEAADDARKVASFRHASRGARSTWPSTWRPTLVKEPSLPAVPGGFGVACEYDIERKSAGPGSTRWSHLDQMICRTWRALLGLRGV